MLEQVVDRAVEQVTQDCFRQFMALKANPGLVQARAQVARDVGQRIKAQLRGIANGAE